MVDKAELAGALEEIGILLELAGESRFKVRAYERGARVVEGLPDDIGTLIREKRLTEYEGIGSALASQLEELWTTGKSSLLLKLRAMVPPGSAELARVPGLTARRIQTLHSALGIESVEQLREACIAGRVRTVKGFGAKTEQRLLEASLKSEQAEHRVRLVEALDLQERLQRHLLNRANIESHAVGAVRRFEESVSEFELLVVTGDHAAAWNALEKFPAILRIDPETHSARLANGLALHVHFALPESVGSALVFTTGPREHVLSLERLAELSGLSFTAEGLRTNTNVLLESEPETKIYAALGVQYVPPELRARIDSVEALKNVDTSELVTRADILGAVHCHTNYSDGKDSIEAMARAAEALGLKYITITDHSPSAYYANGVGLEALKAQWDEIDRVQEQVEIRILRGTESDILADGSLDYPDAMLERFDIIIASIHSRMKLDRKQMTERIVRAMKMPCFKIWGHPLGRLIENRSPIDCDVPEILDAISGSAAAIEINGDPHRLDLPPEWIPLARERGIPFVLSVDAHSTRGLNVLDYAVGIARRGGLQRSEILNTQDAEQFRQRVKPSRAA